MKRSRPAQWWEREDLRFDGDRLTLAGVALDQVARKRGTPLYAYSADRIRQNLRRLSSALRRRRVRHRIFYALKANRFRPLLGVIRDTGMCGVDVCSPGELLLARRAGFPEEAISYTGTSASDDDLAVIRRFPRIAVNCDSLSMLRRIGRLQPGRPVGLRVNPEIGFGWHGKRLLRYSGGRPSKFGIYRQQFAEALEVAASHRLRVEGIHFHCGCGYLGGQLPLFGRVLDSGPGSPNRCRGCGTSTSGEASESRWSGAIVPWISRLGAASSRPVSDSSEPRSGSSRGTTS